MNVVTETMVVITMTVDEAATLARSCAGFGNDSLDALSEAIADHIDID